MKKTLGLILFGALCVSAAPAFAQEKSPEKAKSEEKTKPAIPVKVQVVLTEYDGDKKIASMPYSFISLADDKHWTTYNSSLRTGVRIPIEIDGKDQKTTYMDVGSNIDCGIQSQDDGRYYLRITLEQSSLYPGGGSSDEQLGASHPNGQPIIRQFRISGNYILKDGQTLETVSSTNPLSGHVLRISITINALK